MVCMHGFCYSFNKITIGEMLLGQRLPTIRSYGGSAHLVLITWTKHFHIDSNWKIKQHRQKDITQNLFRVDKCHWDILCHGWYSLAHTHAFAHAHHRAIQKHIDTQTHTRKPKLILSNRDRHSATQLKKWNTWKPVQGKKTHNRNLV